MKLMPGSAKALPAMDKMNRFLNDYNSFLNKYARIRMELYESEKNDIYTPTGCFYSAIICADSGLVQT